MSMCFVLSVSCVPATSSPPCCPTHSPFPFCRAGYGGGRGSPPRDRERRRYCTYPPRTSASTRSNCNCAAISSTFYVLFRSPSPRSTRTPRTTHHAPRTSQITPHTSHLAPHTSHFTPHTSHRTPRTSHFTPRTSHLTPRTSHLTPHTSHLTPHTSHLAHHTLHTTHLTPRTSHLTPHTSHLTDHRSQITPHTSHRTHHTTHNHTAHINLCLLVHRLPTRMCSASPLMPHYAPTNHAHDELTPPHPLHTHNSPHTTNTVVPLQVTQSCAGP
jgi:hypothetical protein